MRIAFPESKGFHYKMQGKNLANEQLLIFHMIEQGDARTVVRTCGALPDIVLTRFWVCTNGCVATDFSRVIKIFVLQPKLTNQQNSPKYCLNPQGRTLTLAFLLGKKYD